MSREATTNATSHVPGLDGIRGLAILLVMLLHLWCMPPVSRLEHAIALGSGLGWFGVDMFFVLSGFLITGILLDAKGGANYFRNFYVRRALRIFPLYYLILIVSLYVLPHALPPNKAARFGTIAGDEIYYWLYLSNFAIARAGLPRHGVLDVTWSLAIEEQFYIVWPAVVMLVSRMSLVRIATALIALSLGVRIALHLYSNYNDFSIYVLTPCRLDGLAMGAILAVWARQPGGLGRFRRAALITVLGTLPLAIAIPVAEEMVVNESAGVGLNPVFNVVGFPIVAAMFGAVLILVVSANAGSLTERVFSSAFLQIFGRYSYGLYLIHLPLRALIRDRIFGPSSFEARFHFPRFLGSELPGQLMFYALAGATSLAVAWLSYQLFEKRFLSLKRFFPSAARASTTTPGEHPLPAPRSALHDLDGR